MGGRHRGAVAVISGGSSGIGRAVATALADEGARVITVSRRDHGADTRCEHRPCDVTDAGAWRELLVEVEQEAGRIDILVNAAGVEQRRGMATVTEADVAATMAVNFGGTVTGTLAVLPGMLRLGRGVVCNVSSDHARAPGPGTPAYCASKAAVSAFTESLSHEAAARGVRLHVLYPGWVPTALGQGAVDAGMRRPPRFVHRTEEQVARLVLDRIGGSRFEVNASRLATLAPVMRALAPRAYAAGVRRAT